MDTNVSYCPLTMSRLVMQSVFGFAKTGNQLKNGIELGMCLVLLMS